MLLLFVYEQFGERENVEENISVHLIVLTFWVFALNSLTVDKILYCSSCSINFYCLVLNEWNIGEGQTFQYLPKMSKYLTVSVAFISKFMPYPYKSTFKIKPVN